MIHVVAIDMGYGHLRAAQPLADALGVPMGELDRGELASPADARAWSRARFFHEGLSRVSQWPVVGRPFLALMDFYTHIAPLQPPGDQSHGTIGTRGFQRMVDRGLGARFVKRLNGHKLVSTFYAPSLIADRAGLPAFCLITDADCHRIWVPDQPAGSRIHYFAPSPRVAERLRAYGIPEDRITLTGFPLPLELLGGPELPSLRANLSARLSRLDRGGRLAAEHAGEIAAELPSAPAGAADLPPLVVFAVGGAGAQSPLAHRIVRALAPALRAGRLRLALVAGLRRHLAASFRRWAKDLDLSHAVDVLYEPAWPDYYRRFNELLARADVLWTKPSEMTFYAALGLPLVLAPPVGGHERYNARWAQEQGAGLPQLDPAAAEGWLFDWLADGTLAKAAWSGFRRLPARGAYEIAAVVTNSPD